MSNRFPIKCFECNALIGDKYEEYLKLVVGMSTGKPEDPKYIMFNSDGEFRVGEILDKLDIRLPCCRTIMLTNLTLNDVMNLIKG